MDQKRASSIQSLQQPRHNPHLIQQQLCRRPSRFKPVRFQEYRMQWGGSNLTTLAVSVSDVYVLDPECPALAAASASTKLDELNIENRGRASENSSSRLPSDAELVAAAEAAVTAADAACGCRRQSRVGFRHQRHVSDNRGGVDEPVEPEDNCDEGGENYGVGEVVWTLQSSGFVHEMRCPRRSCTRACQQRQRQRMRLQLNCSRLRQLPPALQPQSRPRANSAFSAIANRERTSKPPPTSPYELPSPQLPSAPAAPPPHKPKQPPSDLPALKTAAASAEINPALPSPATSAATSATSPTTSDEVCATGVGSAESCAESCVATVAQVLQDALLAAVRAETEPLERRLAEKDAELGRLRQELRDRDARLRRLNRILTCRRMLTGIHQQRDGGGGRSNLTQQNGTGSLIENGAGSVNRNERGCASTSALSSLL